MMAQDAFLQFKEVGDNAVVLNGETKDKIMSALNPIPFEIAEWSFGASNKLNIGSGSGGAGAGKVEFAAFNVTKAIDKASPYLFHTCCAGGHYKEVLLQIRRAGGTSAKQSGDVYLKFDFKLVAIQSIKWQNGDPMPTEGIAFEYGALQISYSPQKSSGAMDTAKTQSWSRVLNSETFGAG